MSPFGTPPATLLAVKSLPNNRSVYIALLVMVAFVAIVVPTCRMVGCSMTGAMAWKTLDTPSLFGDCGGTYVTSTTPAAVVPPGAETLVLVAVAMVLASAGLFTAEAHAQRLVPVQASPPPPALDPRGMRLRI